MPLIMRQSITDKNRPLLMQRIVQFPKYSTTLYLNMKCVHFIHSRDTAVLTDLRTTRNRSIKRTLMRMRDNNRKSREQKLITTNRPDVSNCRRFGASFVQRMAEDFRPSLKSTHRRKTTAWEPTAITQA